MHTERTFGLFNPNRRNFSDSAPFFCPFCSITQRYFYHNTPFPFGIFYSNPIPLILCTLNTLFCPSSHINQKIIRTIVWSSFIAYFIYNCFPSESLEVSFTKHIVAATLASKCHAIVDHSRHTMRAGGGGVGNSPEISMNLRGEEGEEGKMETTEKFLFWKDLPSYHKPR